VLAVVAGVASNAAGPSLVGRLLADLNLGVTIFFVISGFLLYRPFIAHRAGGAAAPRVLDYVKRRVLRIYPAYWVILTILAIAPGITVIVDGHWWPMYALLHTLPVYQGRRCVDLPQTCGLAQTWSLVVEVTFYAVLPVFAFGMAWLTRRLGVSGWMRAQLITLAVLSCLSVSLQLGPAEARAEMARKQRRRLRVLVRAGNGHGGRVRARGASWLAALVGAGTRCPPRGSLAVGDRHLPAALPRVAGPALPLSAPPAG
jgi:peptidoglycan/LPS O-acetylase OafA/YrhL